MWVSELLLWTAKIVDEISLIKTVWTEAISHDPAVTYICAGHQLPGRASLSSWLSYSLGTMNQNLPAFVVMTATWSSKAAAQVLYNRLWSEGFLPSKYQGVALCSKGDPVLFLSNPPGVDPATRRRSLDAINRLNHNEFESIADPETQARIAQYEIAFRMQTSVPELNDISNGCRPFGCAPGMLMRLRVVGWVPCSGSGRPGHAQALGCAVLDSTS